MDRWAKPLTDKARYPRGEQKSHFQSCCTETFKISTSQHEKKESNISSFKEVQTLNLLDKLDFFSMLSEVKEVMNKAIRKMVDE